MEPEPPSLIVVLTQLRTLPTLLLQTTLHSVLMYDCIDNFRNFFQWNCELISVLNNPVCHVVFWACGRPNGGLCWWFSSFLNLGKQLDQNLVLLIFCLSFPPLPTHQDWFLGWVDDILMSPILDSKRHSISESRLMGCSQTFWKPLCMMVVFKKIKIGANPSSSANLQHSDNTTMHQPHLWHSFSFRPIMIF